MHHANTPCLLATQTVTSVIEQNNRKKGESKMLFIEATSTVSQQMAFMLDNTERIFATLLAAFQIAEIIRRQR